MITILNIVPSYGRIVSNDGMDLDGLTESRHISLPKRAQGHKRIKGKPDQLYSTVQIPFWSKKTVPPCRADDLGINSKSSGRDGARARFLAEPKPE